jgi:hypothetical protein
VTVDATAELTGLTELDDPIGSHRPDLDEPYVDFADVPAAGQEAELDPHWLELRGDSLLPTLYMPPIMAGTRSLFMRLLASALIGTFLLATSLGICLTYGPNWP